MIRTFRYPLDLTTHQETVLSSWLIQCRRLYNGALEHRRGAYEKAGICLSRYGQQVELSQLRAECPEWADISIEVLRSALARLDLAFAAFFRRCKKGETPGYPKFKKADEFESFSIGLSIPKGNRVRIPKLGTAKFKLYRPMQGRVINTKIVKDVSRWFVCFSCEFGDAPAKVSVKKAVGIDLGLKTFAVLSDGREVANQKFLAAGQEVLTRRQQVLERKRLGSASRFVAKKLAAKAHQHIQNQRLDFSKKLAARLYKEFDLVAYEDLDIQMMRRNADFSKSINDAAWGKFIHCLKVKAESTGKWAVPVDPSGTSQRCSSCGVYIEKELSEREHRCSCGFVASRDHNAALNVLALGTKDQVFAGSP